MLRLFADHNFSERIVRGLLRERPGLDVVRARDASLARALDPNILAWVAEEGRVVLTHDVATMPRYAYERMALGLPMPGIIEVRRLASIGTALEDLLIILECTSEEEMSGQVLYVPL